MTKFVKKDQVTSSWYEIDAKNAVVGRLATIISKIIRGKNKNTYTPHMDHGDFVVVKNIEQIKFTGKKFQNKKYYRHTGYPGGIIETTPEKLFEKKPGEALKLAVKRMLPGGVLGRKQLTKLKIYSVVAVGLLSCIQHLAARVSALSCRSLRPSRRRGLLSAGRAVAAGAATPEHGASWGWGSGRGRR